MDFVLEALHNRNEKPQLDQGRKYQAKENKTLYKKFSRCNNVILLEMFEK